MDSGKNGTCWTSNRLRSEREKEHLHHTEVPRGGCLKVLHAYAEMDDGKAREFRDVIRAAWAAFDARRQVLHRTVFLSMAWATPGLVSRGDHRSGRVCGL